MTGKAQIDKAGRIVLPKKFRDALHLTPGTQLKLEQSGDTLILQQDYPEMKLEMRDGFWVMDGGPDSDADLPEILQQTYQERHKRIMEDSGLE